MKQIVLLAIKTIVLLLLLNEILIAQPDQLLVLQRINGAIKIDGMSDEPAWQNITPFPLTMLYPTFQGTLSEKTEIRIAYDDLYIYASMRANDSDPSKIRATTFYRDRWGPDDQFVLLLDTLNDNENAMLFLVTPVGTRVDELFFNDAEPGRGPIASLDWNTFWDADAVLTDEGWFAEVRIPFSSLRFKADENGDVIMGLKTYRWIPRKGENQIFPESSPDDGTLPFFKPSTMQKVLLRGIKSSNPVYFTPYVLSGVDQFHEINSDETGLNRRENTTFNVGGDLKYNLATNLTMDLTVNTDFAQVEVDDEQVNLTRFGLFFPEKRLFFQERNDLFQFSTGGDTRLFYSRRIGLSDAGQPIDIYGGARLVGRLGQWDLGVLNMQTEKSQDLASENFGVLRLKRKILNQNSSIGTIYTHRISTKGDYNFAYGLDGFVQLRSSDFLVLNWAQTFDQNQNTINSGRFRGRLQRTGEKGMTFHTELIWSGKKYNPGLGFVTARNFTSVSGQMSYGWQPSEISPLRLHQLAGDVTTRIRNSDGIAELTDLGLKWSFEGKTASEGWVRFSVTKENLPKVIRLSDDAFVPTGDYTYYGLDAYYNTPAAKPIIAELSAFAGNFYDGGRLTLDFRPTWNISPHFGLGLQYLLNAIRFPDRDQRFNSHIARLRVNTALNIHFFLEGFVQYNSTRDLLISNIRLRYHFREGSDLFLLYNEGFDADKNIDPFDETRTLRLKYTYTFIH